LAGIFFEHEGTFSAEHAADTTRDKAVIRALTVMTVPPNRLATVTLDR